MVAGEVVEWDSLVVNEVVIMVPDPTRLYFFVLLSGEAQRASLGIPGITVGA